MACSLKYEGATFYMSGRQCPEDEIGFGRDESEEPIWVAVQWGPPLNKITSVNLTPAEAIDFATRLKTFAESIWIEEPGE